MSFFLYAALFTTVFLGGISFFYFKSFSKTHLKLLLAFSGAYLFALAILHLIPEVYAGNDLRVGWFILAGFFLGSVLVATRSLYAAIVVHLAWNWVMAAYRGSAGSRRLTAKVSGSNRSVQD